MHLGRFFGGRCMWLQHFFKEVRINAKKNRRGGGWDHARGSRRLCSPPIRDPPDCTLNLPSPKKRNSVHRGKFCRTELQLGGMSMIVSFRLNRCTLYNYILHCTWFCSCVWRSRLEVELTSSSRCGGGAFTKIEKKKLNTHEEKKGRLLFSFFLS